MPSQPSSFVWYELLTNDIDAAAAFYGAAVGWTVSASEAPDMDYRRWEMNGVPVGGLMAIPAAAAVAGMQPGWLGYLGVDDVDAVLKGIESAGGSLHMPARTIPDVGRIAMVADPQGAVFYVIAATGDRASGSFAMGSPGHGGWHELRTTDWQAAIGFYGAQFGWRKSDALDMGPMGIYLLFNAGGDAIGGMMNAPQAPRPHWMYYFCVADVDAAKTRVEGAGGSVENGPHEVPGGAWIIHATDPQGAKFALVGPRTARA